MNILILISVLFSCGDKIAKKESRSNFNAPIKWGGQELINAATEGDNEKIESLISQGADLSCVDEAWGSTALMWAIQNDKIKSSTIEKIMNAGADPNHISKLGDTPLIMAACRGDITILEKLIVKKAKIDHANNDGNTALIFAVFNNKTSIVKLLLGKGAKVDHVNNGGNTALIIASAFGYKKIVKLLLDKKANVNHVNNNGDTAVTFAEKNGHTSIFRILQQA